MLKEKSIVEYCDLLKSDRPAPGGGSSLAVVALNGISLVEMTCSVTLTKLFKNNQTSKSLVECLEQLKPLHDKCIELIDLDGQAFENILSAMRLPKSTEIEKSVRREQLQKAYTDSAYVCLELLQVAVDAYFLADKAIADADKFVVSDAHIGKELLKCVGICQRHNIEANANCIADVEVKNKIESSISFLLEELDPISFAMDEIK